jgi:hypothetical protein
MGPIVHPLIRVLRSPYDRVGDRFNHAFANALWKPDIGTLGMCSRHELALFDSYVQQIGSKDRPIRLCPEVSRHNDYWGALTQSIASLTSWRLSRQSP